MCTGVGLSVNINVDKWISIRVPLGGRYGHRPDLLFIMSDGLSESTGAGPSVNMFMCAYEKHVE